MTKGWIFWSLVAAWVIGKALERRLGMPPGSLVLGLWAAFLGLGCALAACVESCGTRMAEAHCQREAARARITAMPLDRARAEARKLLEDPRRFKVVRGSALDLEVAAQLGPELRALLGEFARISSLYYALEIDAPRVEPSTIRNDHLRLGTASEHTELAAPTGSDEVLLLADDVPAEDAEEDRFPSLYHYLLVQEHEFGWIIEDDR